MKMMRFSEEQYRKWFNGRPQKPVSAGVVFLNEQKQVLILRLTYQDDWGIPSGGVEKHESPLDGAIRETKEEIGIAINRKDVDLVAVDYRPAKNGLTDKLYFYFFGGELSRDDIASIKLGSGEIAEMRFVDMSEAENLLSAWTYQQVKIVMNLEAVRRLSYSEDGAPVKGLQ